MTVNLSVTVRNARLDALETAIGPDAVLKIRSGAKPTACADADAGTPLATINLPSDWMANASGGQKAMSGTWADNSADATGTAGHFRVYEDDGVTCHMQGTVTTTGGGGDMEVSNTSFAEGQEFQVTSFVLQDNNA